MPHINIVSKKENILKDLQNVTLLHFPIFQTFDVTLLQMLFLQTV